MGVEKRIDAVAELAMTVAAALAEKDRRAAEFMGERFRRMLARSTRDEEGFTVAFAALMAIEDVAGCS